MMQNVRDQEIFKMLAKLPSKNKEIQMWQNTICAMSLNNT